jgi:hypothetical protein
MISYRQLRTRSNDRDVVCRIIDPKLTVVTVAFGGFQL